MGGEHGITARDFITNGRIPYAISKLVHKCIGLALGGGSGSI